jgi:hypothetical protein
MSGGTVSLGSPRTWEVYLAVAVQACAALAIVHALELRGLLVWTVLACLTVSMLVFDRVVCPTTVVVTSQSLIIRSVGMLRKPVILPLSSIQHVAISTTRGESSPMLTIEAAGRTRIALGPWAAWRPDRQRKALQELLAAIETGVASSMNTDCVKGSTS